MGNSSSIDLPAARVLNRDAFVVAIDRFSEEYCNTATGLFAKATDAHALFESPGIHVAVRKRPLWPSESERGEFDVMSVGGSLADGSVHHRARDTMWLHNARLRLDARHMYVDHHGFPFDAVFDERHDTEEVYRRAVAPLVAASQKRGGRAAVVAFGQTGTGKTFTMTRIAELAAADLFVPSPTRRVELTAVEVAGSNVRDLLAAPSTDDGVVLREDAGGNLALVGAAPHRVGTADELCALLRVAYEKRATCATGVNDTSSRSHAIYRVALWEGEAAEEAEKEEEGAEDQGEAEAEAEASGGAAVPWGVLTMVDLAGSEWSRDQASHSRERQAEAREINASLMTLKQCVRARVSADRVASQTASQPAKGKAKAKPLRMPIREAKLTRILRDCFVDPLACTLVIACVSPACGDLEHTMESLRGGQGDVATASGWGMPAETLLSSNVPGVAALGAEDAAAIAAAAEDAAVKAKAEGGGSSSSSSSTSASASERECAPSEWSPSQVCEWWTTQAALAFRAAAVASGEPPLTFTIEVKASVVAAEARKQDVAQGRKGKCKLGLSFAKEPAGEAPRVGVVSGAGLVGATLRRENRTLPSGSLLVGVGSTRFDAATTPRKSVLAVLKPRAIELGAAAVAWHAWACERGGDGEVEKEREQEQEQASPPPELSLVLTFQSARVECPRMPPPIPSIFTGASRMGISEGTQLCADFGTKSFRASKFVRATAPHKFVGTTMWTVLRERMVVVPRVVEEERS